MDEAAAFCFVLMPFRPELHYFFLYLAQHIRANYGIVCVRADSSVSGEPFLQKIIQRIREAEVVIADCSGGNPNVFYELGIADALGKRVVHITSDPPSAIPSDVRHYDFILYRLDDHVPFLAKLDSALADLLRTRYDDYYDRAVRLSEAFRADTSLRLEIAPRERFLESIRFAERQGELPVSEVGALSDAAVAPFLLPKIIASSRDPAVMGAINSWIARRTE